LGKLEVYARIVWKMYDQKEKRYRYGMKFNEILAEDDYKLRGLLRSHAEPPSPMSVRPS